MPHRGYEPGQAVRSLHSGSCECVDRSGAKEPQDPPSPWLRVLRRRWRDPKTQIKDEIGASSAGTGSISLPFWSHPIDKPLELGTSGRALSISPVGGNKRRPEAGAAELPPTLDHNRLISN